ncbi:hypothetical protein AWB85_24225 [Mycobacteroides immunogenum]|uniref:Uncharacterized protein n=1 Tax=Mycobacteroides immunogenum TaxID=83262 RepID=A0A179VEH2_9MYCO|nr:hypothetical protein [Mycobacteroides immunogenum]OAT68676.1 hypothetical protein AWB85_24225 [Mycobacteroides immunogenum]
MESGTTLGSFKRWMSQYPSEIPQQLAVNLNRLGKTGRHDDIDIYFQIYPLPPNARQGDIINSDEYIQAGGKAERLTVEIRRIERDGQPHKYTIGRAEAADEAGATEFIRFGDNEVRVRPSEVLTAAEAIELFQYYYDHDKVAPGWNLRPIDQEVLTGRDA